MRFKNIPADMNTSERYLVFDPALPTAVTVWVARLGHASTLSCDHCRISAYRGTCPHIDAIVNANVPKTNA